METPLLVVALHIGFGLWELCSGFPIDFSSVGTGQVNPLWLSSSSFLAVGFLVVVVAIIFGCVCCRNGKGFQEFSNSNGSLSIPNTGEGFVNPTSSSELTIFPPFGATSTVSDRSSIVRFEPLPDIKPQPANLRPAAFSYGEREISSQDWFYQPLNNFPRNQLKYLQEYGRGWFGRVVEGEAQNIIPNEKLTKVIVKILHEDATPTDQMYFLHEVKFYRDLKHSNVLKLLGRCLETEPFLVLLESCPNGDLKSFLTQNLASARALTEQGVTLQMCCNITSGLQFMHENKFIHTDLAARNCLVGPDLTIKIGDYGNSIEVFKSDYYCAGSVALPVRWCAPETLKCTDVTIETKEVTPLANVWTLAVVIWEICEFCKLPYLELNDDQVIVRVLGEKNYFLPKPEIFCLHKDELYHLMKLCWNPPLQRPTASQIRVILENLISSDRSMEKDTGVDPKRASQDFERRWQSSKPNYIPKRDDAIEAEENAPTSSPKFRGAKVGDSSYVESPLGVFMSTKGSGQDTPRVCLKSEKNNTEEDEDFTADLSSPKSTDEVEFFSDLKKSDSVKNLSGSLDRLNDVAEELKNTEKVDFDYSAEVKPPEILKPDYTLQEPELDSWLKGVEVNNEEDEKFVRKISEAIRDLDEALALEKTSSSEENSGKSSHQNSPGKELKGKDEAVVVDFKLGADTSSFMSFTPKSFELSSLQNTEQPQSLNFTHPISKGNVLESLAEFENYGQESMIYPIINETKCRYKNSIFDESLKENDSFCYAQSRNSSDTEDEIWRKRIERGEFSEKVKEKSKSIADLMVLTHIDASDDSDGDLEKNFERNSNRNSFVRRSGSNPKSSLTSNNFGSENDITNAVLEETFKQSLMKLSSDHKEYGRFDSLGMILPVSSRRDNVINFLKNSDSTEEAVADLTNSVSALSDLAKSLEQSKPLFDPSDFFQISEKSDKNPDSRNNFLGNVASEKLDDNTVSSGHDGASSSIVVTETVVNLDKDSPSTHCDKSKVIELSNNNPDGSSSHLNEECKCVTTIPVEVTASNRQISILLNSITEDEGEIFESLPIIRVTEEESEPMEDEGEVFESPTRAIKPIKFVIKDEITKESVNPTIQIEEIVDEIIEKPEESVTISTPKRSFKFVMKDEPSPDEDVSVILGACEDYTLDYFNGLKTTFGGIQNTPVEETNPNIKEMIDSLMMKESNLDNWDEHLEQTLTQQLNNANFDDISFPSLSLESPMTENPEVRDILGDSFSSTPMTPNKTIAAILESEKLDKIEESIHINGITNLNGNTSEEEYENGKLRTPDDERSSDSGFRDKGSLSESVEDACEGKYNLEDIEAELEEAYVKGAFNNCEVEKEKEKKNCNFDYEESKFYEEENKNDEDFSDIDGEIEFWQNKENSDYYPEISEFSPVNSKGWYLHPPDETKSDGRLDDEFVNALRNELREKLPAQSRSYEMDYVFDELEFDDTKTDINIQYTGRLTGSLSPIVEESDGGTEKVQCTSPGMEEDSNPQRTRKNITAIMESVKTIDTETFMQYLDYMIDNEGREDEEKDITEEIVQVKDEEVNKPMFIVTKDETKTFGNETFEEDIKNALGVETLSGSDSLISDAEQPKSIVLFEDLETDSKCKVIEETKPEDDIIVVDTETNEVTLLESPKPKSYVAFVENDKDDVLEAMTDDSENDGLVFTPDSISPERERSLSDTSRSSNGTRTGDASSEITLSSPDFLSDYFLTPNSEKSPTDSPRRPGKVSETEVQEIIENDEANEIMNELKSSGILNDVAESCGISEDSLEKNECSLPFIPTSYTAQSDAFLRSERRHTSNLLEESSKILRNFERKDSLGTNISELTEGNELSTSFDSSPGNNFETAYEISTSFMGEDQDEDDSEKQELEKEEGAEKTDESKETSKDEEVEKECYTPDWESDSSGGEEEVSSSSGEFIWKDGDKESKLKAVEATDRDAENSLCEKSQSDTSAAEANDEKKASDTKEGDEGEDEDDDEEDEEDDDESSTGSSASITDFVPSAWNSQATPSRPALRSPDKKSEQQQNHQKRNVWFKKQKYHCVYEYPREPSDTEDVETSPYKHFTYGISTSELPNKHFPYGIDWDLLDGDDPDLSLTDTDSDNGSGKNNKNATEKSEYNFYNLSTFDYDFNNSGMVSDDGEFFVSSSARPFQGNASSQFFPGSQFTAFEESEKQTETDKSRTNDEPWTSPSTQQSNDFITPDSGVEDLTNVTPLDKKTDGDEQTLLLTIQEPDPNSEKVLHQLKFNFAAKSTEANDKKISSEAFGESTSSSPNDLSTSSSNSPSSPLSPTGLGELRHTRDKLKLDLPHNHNTELGLVLTNKKINKIH